MFKLETSPLTISGVLKSGLSLYKSSLKYVVLWSFILSIVHIIPYLFNYIGFYQKINGSFEFSWWAILIFMVLLIAEAYFVAVLFYSIYSIATEQKVNQIEALRVAKERWIHIYFGEIVYFIAVALSMLLLLLPAVFVAILFSMFLPLIVIEKQTVYPAFDGSVRLVWGNWWQTFFVLFIPYVLAYLARSFGKFTHWGEWMLLVDAVVLTFVLPYFYAVIFIQYNNLKIIKSLPEPISTRPRTQPQ